MTDTVVVGGGLVGLAVAWRAAARGVDVTLVDADPGSGASGVAAGMLAPVTEAAYGEEALLALNTLSARSWADFAADLGRASGIDVGYRDDPTLLVALDGDDLAAVDELLAFQQRLGLDVTRLRSRDCRAHEPLLHPRVRGGVLARDDHRVDAQQVVRALLVAATRAGVRLERQHATALDHADGRVRGVRLAEGSSLSARQVVLAAGTWSADLHGLPVGVRPPVRPVKGQLLVLRAGRDEPRPVTTVRALARGRTVYLVPRDDGRLVVGATQEERGHDVRVTAGGVRQLLDDAVAVMPGVDELTLLDTRAGLRPATPDNRPLIGPTELDGLLLATGHHRNGALLTPLTADAVTDLLTDRTPAVDLSSVDPRRFSEVRA
ncbi:glycine oxidase ThiO [Egicoccus halophilus]|uniref:glycine oxidase n=1 Tax=Egicoccus halophilus TaxID=1670830 RepID=A0A8J3AH03_9ACTN|nr:glycine oxidase ThiO [Egicoccus halophilus]GGI09459.1 glycine oxidase ThiO [Egicoccus halophilus]